METCGGYCCERFRIRSGSSGSSGSYGPAELAAILEKQRDEDTKKTVNMLVYLGYSATNGNGIEDERKSHWFTCKHFDPTTRLCKDYANRPEMCRNHGGKSWQPCGYDKCQLKPREIPVAGVVYEKKKEGAA